jgi:hypothetical protein
MLLWPCRCYGAWFHSNSHCSEWTMLIRKRFHSSCSWSEWEVLLRKLETLTVCMWCFRIRCGGRVCSTAVRLLENRLHSVIRCLAVCTALSGQLQVGEDVFLTLWRYSEMILRRKPKYSEKNRSYFVHHKIHTKWPGIESGICRLMPCEITLVRFGQKAMLTAEPASSLEVGGHPIFSSDELQFSGLPGLSWVHILNE